MTRSTASSPLARRRTVLGAALLASAALGAGLLSGCGAGQITGTDTQVAAVPGVEAQSADGRIALREAMIPYAAHYERGATVPVEMRLFNNSNQPVRLTGAVTGRGALVLVGGPAASPSVPASPSAPASPTGSPSVTPSGGRSPNGSPSVPASPTAAASPSPTQIGSSKIDVEIPVNGYALLTVETRTYLAIPQLQGEEINAGGQIEGLTLTFTYADGSTTTIADLAVPMAPPLSPLPRPSGGAEH